MTSLTYSLCVLINFRPPHFLIIVSLTGCQDDLRVLTLVRDSEVLLVIKRVPERTSFPMARNSLHIGKYSLNSSSYHLPLKRHSHTLCSSGSFSEALSISRVVKATGVDSWATHFTYSSAWFFSFEFDVGCNRLIRNLQCS